MEFFYIVPLLNLYLLMCDINHDLQIQDCGMVLEEQPGKVSEAFRLFLQGQGYGK
jgi:hypothetical protein